MPEDKSYTKGVYLFHQNKHREAIRNFNKVLSKKPDFDMAWLYKGMSLYSLGNLKDGIINIDRALDLNSSLAEAWLTKMNIFLITRKFEEALKCCNEALKIHPNKYWGQKASVHEHLKHFKEALECVDKFLTYNPDNDKIGPRLKMALENGLKYGKYYYIPILTNPVLLTIPIADDIIYSSKMNIKWRKVGESTRIPLLRSTLVLRDVYDQNLLTDVLMTTKGIAFLLPLAPSEEFKEISGPKYISWNQVVLRSKGEMTLRLFFECKLQRDPYLESREAYEQRLNSFNDTIRKLRYDYTKNCLEEAKEFTRLNKDDEALQRIEDGLVSNVYQPSLSLSDELLSLKNSILRQMESEKRKMFEECENKIFDYLKLNEGQAFTAQSLMKRLENNFENSELMSFFKNNIQELLNRLLFNKNKTIHSALREGKTYYFS